MAQGDLHLLQYVLSSPSEHQSQDEALTSTQPQRPAAVGSEQDDVPRGTSPCNTLIEMYILTN